MRRWYRYVGLLLCGFVAFGLLTGCRRHEHRKVRVQQEQHEGEVQEERPGEMIVE